MKTTSSVTQTNGYAASAIASWDNIERTERGGMQVWQYVQRGGRVREVMYFAQRHILGGTISTRLRGSNSPSSIARIFDPCFYDAVR